MYVSREETLTLKLVLQKELCHYPASLFIRAFIFSFGYESDSCALQLTILIIGMKLYHGFENDYHLEKLITFCS